MRTEKEIKKRIIECKRKIKEFSEFFNNSNSKDKKQIKELINDYSLERDILKWVLTKADKLPF